MATEVTMIRTIGGEFIIGTQDKPIIIDGEKTVDTSDTYTLVNARIFNLQMTRQGAAIAFIPLFPFSTSKNIDTLVIDKRNVLIKVDEDLLDGEIINGYKSNITGIDLSAANKVVI